MRAGCNGEASPLICARLPSGGVAEWLKALAWKACIRETVSWVRIPLPPPPGETNRNLNFTTRHCRVGLLAALAGASGRTISAHLPGAEKVPDYDFRPFRQAFRQPILLPPITRHLARVLASWAPDLGLRQPANQAESPSVRLFFSRALYFCAKVRFCGVPTNRRFYDAEFRQVRNALPCSEQLSTD